MNQLKILNRLTFHQLILIGQTLHNFFPLVNAKRITDLILQVDSIDIAIHLLTIHENKSTTLDALLYDYLRGQDENI